jgi:hypothetical protein
MMERLRRKSFLSCVVNQDEIDSDIARVEGRVADAFAMFSVRDPFIAAHSIILRDEGYDSCSQR